MRKNLHRNTPKLNIPLCIASVIFCLTLFSTYFVSGLYARYTSTGQAGSSARVAVFSVKGSEDTLTKPIVAELVPGEVSETKLIINNSSEVAVDYIIEVKNNTENLPLQFYVEKQNNEEPPTNPIPFEPYEFVHEDSVAAGSGDTTYILYIEWESHGDGYDLENIGMVDQILVTVTATQAD